MEEKKLFCVAVVKFEKGAAELKLELKQRLVIGHNEAEVTAVVLQQEIFGSKIALIQCTEVPYSPEGGK